MGETRIIDPDSLERALTTARQLWALSEDIERHLEPRVTAADQALLRWSGPDSTKFSKASIEENLDSWKAITTLRTEANAWATYWADTTNKQNQHQRDQELKDYDNRYKQEDGSYTHDAPARPASTAQNVYPPTSATDFRP